MTELSCEFAAHGTEAWPGCDGELADIMRRAAEHARAAHNGALPEYVTLRKRRYGKHGYRWEADNGSCRSSFPKDRYADAVSEAWWLTFCEDDYRERTANA